MRKYTRVFGHVEVFAAGGKPAKDPKVLISTRYGRKTFYKLATLCEQEGVSVNSKVNEIVEKFLGVR